MKSPIQLCLVGAGRAGRVHANSITRYLPEARLTAIVEAIPDSRQEAGENFGIDLDRQFESLQTALDQCDVLYRQ